MKNRKFRWGGLIALLSAVFSMTSNAAQVKLQPESMVILSATA